MRNLRRLNRCQWVLACALVLACGWLHAGSVISHPYRGVTQIVRTETSPRSEHINVMQIDLTTPGIRFLVSNGNNPVNSTNCEVTTAKTLDYMTAQNGQIAINAHFFQAFSASDPITNKWVVGLAASQGYVYSSFEGPTPATSNPVNSLTLTQDYAIMTNAPALNIDTQNNAQIVHYDASFADKKHVLEPVTLYNALCGSAQIVTNGAKSIPTYTQNAATGLISGTSGYSDSNSWYNAVNARTAIGLSSDNHTLTLFTIDNAGGSNGMSVGEVADMLRTDYGVWNALNLDGGGSTTMAFQDPVSKVRSVINSSSNGATPRIVATSLVVFAEPRIAVEQPAGTGLTNNSATIGFGSVSVGSTSGPITFTVKNNGAADLTGLTVTGGGTNAAEYTITTQPAASVAAAGSTTFTVTFKPAATGTRTAVLHLASNDATQNPFNINLTGAGTVPAIAVEQPAGTPLGSGTSTVDFGSALNGTATPLTFTIRDTGTASLSGIVATADGTNAADYTITAQPAASLPPSGTTTVTVTFKPPATGTRNAVLHIASNDPTQNPFNVNLTGVGTAPAIAVEQPPGTPLGSGTSTVDFGSAVTGTAAPLTFTIRNTGTATLSGIVATADGTNGADYAITTQPAASLPASGTTTFTVTFNPPATGTRTAVLHIASNDPTWNPFNIILTGAGSASADGGFSSWAVGMGLGADADPMDAPKGDGVNNLLKFAFNMDPAMADTRCLTVGAGQTAGLPGIHLIGGPMIQMEFIRRKASTHPGITYTAQFGSDLTGWDDYPDPIIPVSIDETWERITVPDFSSFASLRRFARVVVSQP